MPDTAESGTRLRSNGCHTVCDKVEVMSVPNRALSEGHWAQRLTNVRSGDIWR